MRYNNHLELFKKDKVFISNILIDQNDSNNDNSPIVTIHG